nr:hypothetical protein CFP56_25703 [Quercus suber]
MLQDQNNFQQEDFQQALAMPLKVFASQSTHLVYPWIRVFLPPAMPTTISPSHFQHPNQNPFSYWSSASPNFSFTSMLQSNDFLNHLSQNSFSNGFTQLNPRQK